MQAVHALQPTMLSSSYSARASHQLQQHGHPHSHPHAHQHQSHSLARTGTLAAMPTPPTQPARKRKRAANAITVSYSEIKEYDASGASRDVIVIDDTPPPATASPASTTNGGRGRGTATRASKQFSTSYQPTSLAGPVRTRARAALEAQASASSSSSTVHAAAPPPPKKRKRELADEAVPGTPGSAKKPQYLQQLPLHHSTQSASKNWLPPQPDPAKLEEPCDDKEGHYIIRADDMIHERYRTVRLLGQGTFGKVVEAYDTHQAKKVAIKIIRAIPKYRDASKIEIRVLQKLKERDPLNRHKCIHLTEMFDHKNHICIVSELYGMCVYDFLKENEFAPFPRHHIQQFARQLLGSVAFLHDLRLIHTDLKPENILLVHNDFHQIPVAVPGKRNAPPKLKRILDSTDIRLIDFGSATFENEYHSTVVSTRHYRAPEIILGLGWSFPCDAFSLGCILVEFYTGLALYQTHDNLEHLAMMEVVMGRMPERFARSAARSKPEFFKEGARLDWPKPKASRQSKKDVRACRTLTDIIPPTDMVNKQFADLVRRLLAFDPAQRITVKEALQHPYFQLEVPEEM